MEPKDETVVVVGVVLVGELIVVLFLIWSLL